MKIISWNVNGIRSVYRKGFLRWLKREKPDILCLQETKAHQNQLPFDLTTLTGYHTVFNSAKRKGYSGVGLYSLEKPQEIKKDLGHKRFDREGRFIETNFCDFTSINFYIPHGNRDQKDIPYKLEVYEKIFEYIKNHNEENLILCGDFNIAHKERDLARPKSNWENTMFTEAERAQLDHLINLGFVDSFRKFNKEGGNYSWWPYSKSAREKNIGWRIDYIFTSVTLTGNLQNAFIQKEISLSDHVPVGIKISL